MRHSRRSAKLGSESRKIYIWQHFFIAMLMLTALPVAKAALIGSTVTADLTLGGPGNWYDSTLGLNECQPTPTTTFLNGNGFCALDYSYNGYFTTFTSSGFSFIEQAESIPLGGLITLTLTDIAFEGLSISQGQNSFLGLTYGINGDVVLVNIPGQPYYASPDLIASFNFSSGSTVPEPQFFGPLLIAIIAMWLASVIKRHRHRTRRLASATLTFPEPCFKL